MTRQTSFSLLLSPKRHRTSEPNLTGFEKHPNSSIRIIDFQAVQIPTPIYNQLQTLESNLTNTQARPTPENVSLFLAAIACMPLHIGTKDLTGFERHLSASMPMSPIEFDIGSIIWTLVFQFGVILLLSPIHCGECMAEGIDLKIPFIKGSFKDTIY